MVSKKIKLNCLDGKDLRAITKAKIKRAESAKLKGSTSNKLYRKLTVKCSEIGNKNIPLSVTNLTKPLI